MTEASPARTVCGPGPLLGTGFVCRLATHELPLRVTGASPSTAPSNVNVTELAQGRTGSWYTMVNGAVDGPWPGVTVRVGASAAEAATAPANVATAKPSNPA